MLKEADFVIVGGGSAGAVIASRLSENSKFNICLWALLVKHWCYRRHMEPYRSINYIIANVQSSYPRKYKKGLEQRSYS